MSKIYQNPLIVGVGGVAQAGKDTFIDKVAEKLEIPVLRFKFAHELRTELNFRLSDWLNVDFFTENPEEKNLVRPIMVYCAEFVRKNSRGLYFVNKIKESMNCYTDKQFYCPSLGQQEFDFSTKSKKPFDAVFTISDLRFCEFEFDEIDFVNANGLSVHIERDGIVPANPVEQRNDSNLREKSKIKLSLPDISRELEYARNVDYVVSQILSFK
jgi:hypothetical protein